MRNDLCKFSLRGATNAVHALSRLTPPKKKGAEDALKTQLQDVIQIQLPEAYAAAYARWDAATRAIGATHFEATTTGPLAIGLGNASAYEVGLTLHHTYGVPYLPARALKGLALRAALANGVAQEDQETLFGTTKEAGYVTFWDGWLMPTSQPTLQLDTITVHHPQYYSGGSEWPTDFDDPNPVPFLSVPVGLAFEVRISGEVSWAQLAAKLLVYGLNYLGLGGKTNAGYGGFSCTQPELMLSPEEQEKAEALKQFEGKRQTLEARIKSINMGNAKTELTWLKGQVADLPAELRAELLRQFLERALGDKRTAGKRKIINPLKRAIEEAEADV